MAELDTSSGGNKGGKVRSKKQSTRVDLTAMVDLAFLLITFFMLTTTLQKSKAMDIVKPDKDVKDKNRLELKASSTMTILLGKNDKIAWYMGEAGKSAPEIVSYGSQIREAILKNKKLVAAFGDPKRSLMVVIKPTTGANYKNFVDIMDEINIAKLINAPAIDDDPDHLLDSERTVMKSQGIL
jgi:biopolymer transport protein ExbD